MLSSHLHLGLPSGLLPSGHPTKMLYAPLISAMENVSYRPVLQMVPTTHLFVAAILPPGPHVAAETRSPVIQHIHLGILLTHPVTKPALCLHRYHNVHRVEVYLQILRCLARHNVLRAPCASVLIVMQPATKIVVSS
jgi:hypothetical protein